MRLKELLEDLTNKINEINATQSGTLKFNLDTPEGQEAFNRATKSLDLALTLWDVSQEVFRPHRKHGYPEGGILNVDEWNEQTFNVVSRLEEIYYEILERRGIVLDDLIS